MIRNPILAVFNPDPSILRAGEDYYIATSTFVWQPGIRLFHSRDLASWTLVGHALHGAHDLRGLPAHGGIWAPSLSRDPATGRFHLTYSLVRSTAAEYFDVDNFVVTAPDAAGPWSAPVYLNSVGFDPSLFHDDDGRHWLVTLEWDPRDGYEHPGAIVLDEWDPRLAVSWVPRAGSIAAARTAAASRRRTSTRRTAGTTSWPPKAAQDSATA